MAKRDWSSIHDEVKEAKSMKTTMVVWVPEWDKTKRGKNLATLSFLMIILMHCENKGLLNACMTKNRMCVFA